ncbi:MAG: alpha/beta hydrolase [Candidatus Uhrbacteria bacterium]
MPAGAKPRVLFLHGAGESKRARLKLLRTMLAQQGVASCAFDMIGHGETGGNLKQSNLKERTEQARAVIDALTLEPPLTIVGASMSGYTAIKLTEQIPSANLILIVPAIYHREAYIKQFDQGFTDIIRQEKSWNNSDAWDILNKFKGNLLVISTEHDSVIPKEIIDRILASANNANQVSSFEVKNAPHLILTYLNDRPERLREVVDQILSTC